MSDADNRSESEQENSEPVAWIAAIVINAALVILFISVVIYCYCRNKAKPAERRRQKLNQEKLLGNRWDRAINSPLVPNRNSGYNVFTVEQKYDNLENIPIKNSNLVSCSCMRNKRREEDIKRNNWVKSDERIASHNIYSKKAYKVNKQNVVWVGNNDRKNETTKYLVYQANRNRGAMKYVGQVAVPKTFPISLNQLRSYLSKEETLNVLVDNKYRFLSEDFKDLSLHEKTSKVDEVYPSRGIIINFKDDEKKKNKKKFPSYGKKCYNIHCEEEARYKCQDCGRVSYCSIKCMREDKPVHKQHCNRPPWRI